MLKVETIQNFNGFGSGGKPGEYYYAQGMKKTRFGVAPGVAVEKLKDSTDLPTLNLAQWYSQGRSGVSALSYVKAFDALGYVYRYGIGFSDYELWYQPGVTTHGNGLIYDQKNRVLMANDRYLSMYDNTANYTTGTISLTNGSTAVVGSGTTFTSGMVGKQIRVGTEAKFYTVATFTDATHIALNSTYTGTTGGSKAYEIFTSITDQWKDFGSANETTDFRSAEIYEDWVLFANKNKVALLNATDDSWNPSGFDFPEGFRVRAIKSSRTGVLLGANFNNRGVIALWDATSGRSIAPWIWLNSTLQSIVLDPITGTWLVITSQGIYQTNGYTLEMIEETPLNIAETQTSIFFNLYPQGAEVIGRSLVFWSSYNYTNRSRPGLYVFNLEKRLYDYAPVSNGVQYGVTGGAIFFDINSQIHCSYKTDTPDKKFLGLASLAGASKGTIIFEFGQGVNDKYAEGVRLQLGVITQFLNQSPNSIDFTVTAKIYNFKRQLWNYGQTNNTSANANELQINGTAFSASVGDEVTVLQGQNAGLTRRITSITNQGLSNEKWTLNSALTGNTESAVTLSVLPFQEIDSRRVNTTEWQDIYFPVKNRIKSKKYLLKVDFDGIGAGELSPELHAVQFFYDEKGIK